MYENNNIIGIQENVQNVELVKNFFEEKNKVDKNMPVY
jgi:hypothetical protein